MVMKTSLDINETKRLLVITGGVSFLIVVATYHLSPKWSFDYGIISFLALINWYALSVLTVGVLDRKPFNLMLGISIKTLLLCLLMVYAMTSGLEVTSFLAGLNTFFICVFLFLAYKMTRCSLELRYQQTSSSSDAPESKAHG